MDGQILEHFNISDEVDDGQIINDRANAISVLRGTENGPLHFISVPTARDQEFIDHSLLSMPNGFIIDFMSNSDESDQNTVTTPQFIVESPVIQHHSQESHHELELQSDDEDRKLTSPFFQLVNNKQCSVKIPNEAQVIVTNKDVVDISSIKDENLKQNHIISEQNLLTIEDQQSLTQSFLNNTQFRVYEPPTYPSLPPLTPITRLTRSRKSTSINTQEDAKLTYTDNSVNLKNIDDHTIEDIDIRLQQRPLAKKNLPHKKRITKRLKTIDRTEQQQCIKNTVDCIKKEIGVFKEESNVSSNENGSFFTFTMHQFICQICGVGSDSQLDFFSHLKSHYEPTSVVQETIDLVNDADKSDEKTEMSQDGLSFNNLYNNIDLQKPEILGENKINNQEAIVPNPNEREKDDEPVIHPTSLKDDLQATEIEFSDTEDMLEGIRGVVDKVQESVDNDSNDCMNLMNERSWYTGSALNGDLSFKNETNVSNEGLDEESGAFIIFNRSDIENLMEQNEQINLDNTEVITEVANIDDTPTHTQMELQPSITEVKEDIKEKEPEKLKKGKKSKVKSKHSLDDCNKDAGDKQKENCEDFDFASKTIQCPKCDKLFNSSNALKYHDLSHTGERPHQCEVCGNRFFAQSALKVHMRLHSGDKPYQCQCCTRQFRQWGDLKYHTISVHTNMKSFQCEFCGKAFARRYSLVVHRRIHTCEKNYKCEFCPKSFRASSYLQNHRKIHTGEKPYSCKVCGKKFRVCGDLRRHENIHTRDKRKSPKGSKIRKAVQTFNLKNSNVELQKEVANSTENQKSVSSSQKTKAPSIEDNESVDFFKTEQNFESSSSSVIEIKNQEVKENEIINVKDSTDDGSFDINQISKLISKERISCFW